MLDCCTKLKNEIPSLLSDDRVKKSLDEQLGCVCESCCIGDFDLICASTDDTKQTADELIGRIALMSARHPTVKTVALSGEKQIKITSIPAYSEKIRKIFSGMECENISDQPKKEVYILNGTRITVIESLCKTVCSKRTEYSEDRLIGMILGLADVLYRSEYLANDEYPQVNVTFDGNLRYKYNYTFLHDLAVYISLHENAIDWQKVFGILYRLKANTPLVILLRLFNYIYHLIPGDIVDGYIKNVDIADEKLLSVEILRCMEKYCTPAELINNDFRRLYYAFLSTENTNGSSFTYPSYSDELSFDESRITYTLDNYSINPYGTNAFHGNANDKSDELSVKWGLWLYGDKLCFLFRIHNKFITAENPEEYLNKCHTVIVISGSDDISHKLTELLIKPGLDENGNIFFKIKDGCEGDIPLEDHIRYEYRFDGDDILFSFAVDKEYLHINKDGMFGLEILTSCSASWVKQKFSDDFIKTLTWMGSEKYWRDMRTYARMKMK